MLWLVGFLANDVHPSVVCPLSVTFVRPTQMMKFSAMFLRHVPLIGRDSQQGLAQVF